mmetsp:Transcript_6264/g.6973  ORF Transcript_6264/g.6973 Transcript_6264/m.6973 type:complete len:767 (+) Transcript_6264:52-2352(+)
MMRVTSVVTLCFLMTVVAVSVRGNVLGIDFGAEFIKIACPHGNSSIDIVLNEQTRRKSHNFVGFRGDDRYFGEDARNLAARFPDNMFTMTNKVLGLKASEVEFFRNLGYTFALTENSRGSVSFKCAGNPVCEYSSEEMVAMMLGYCKSISAKDAKITPQDIVVTIPADWTFNQRQSLIDAAKLVDLKVIGLMHSTTAAALQFGMQRRGFGNDTVHVVIYDMGSTKTEVGVYRFSPPLPPKAGEKVRIANSMGHMETLHIEVDPTLGGRAIDRCIAEMLEKEITEKLHVSIIGGSTPQQHKAQFSLFRAANSVKETLSANTMAPTTIESVAPDRDYSTKVTRAAFEQQCASLFTRAVAVAERAMTKAGVNISEVQSFELMGGGLRPPKIVGDLSAFIGRPVDRTLNSDESAAFGAAYYGAKLSGFLRVRSFSMKDYIPTRIYFTLIDASGKQSARRILFDRPALGSRKSITVNRTEDFIIVLAASNDGESFEELTTVNVSGVTAALESLNYFNPNIVHPNNSHIVRVELRLTEAGIISVEDAEVRFRFAANVTKKSKKPAQAATVGDDSSTELKSEPEAEAEPVVELQMKKRTATLKASMVRPRHHLSKEDELGSRTTLAALDKIDRVKRETAAAKNNLETFMQWMRGEGILDNPDASALMTPEEREVIEQTLSTVSEWYEDGEGSYDSCTKAQYNDQLAILKKSAEGVLSQLEALEKAKLEAKAKEAKVKDAAKKSKKPKPTKGKSKSADTASANEEPAETDNEEL